MFRAFSAIAGLISTLTTDPACESHRTDLPRKALTVCRKRPWSALGNSRSDETREVLLILESLKKMLSNQSENPGCVI
jgi:hypothetical protein